MRALRCCALAVCLAMWACTPPRECVRTEKVRYFDNSEGLLLWLVTNSPGFLAAGEWRVKDVCVEYAKP